jgi:hypothetical protein
VRMESRDEPVDQNRATGQRGKRSTHAGIVYREGKRQTISRWRYGLPFWSAATCRRFVLQLSSPFLLAPADQIFWNPETAI